MNTRRKFLLQGSLATTAFLATKPVKAFSNTITAITGQSLHNNKIVFIHTGNNGSTKQHQVLHNMANLAKAAGSVVLLHAGSSKQTMAPQLKYDATMDLDTGISLLKNNYKTFYKGDIKVAVITANEGGADVINKISELSAYLKNEKQCNMVVCLSQLGYKNKNKIDDITLAGKSTGLDIIISGHAVNHFAHTAVVLNSNRHEVVIQPASGNGFALGNIEMGFDKLKNKNSLAINNLVARNINLS